MGTIKNLIKSFMATLYGRGSSKLNGISLNDYDLVCFDVFDTLIVRNCTEPQDVFDLMQAASHDIITSSFPTNFKKQRLQAEKEARDSKTGEITLEEIYAKLPNLDNADRQRLADFEQQIERKMCVANPDMLPFFENASRKTTVAIVSDMYLPHDCIASILQENGLDTYDTLYVSSSTGKTKRKGDLFELVLSDYHVNPSRVLHVGDHPLSDYRVPRHLGINAFLYRKRGNNG